MTDKPRPNLRTGASAAGRQPYGPDIRDQRPHVIVAKFDSTCLVCHDPIGVGQHRITRHYEEECWVHEGCQDGDIERGEENFWGW